MLRPLVKDLPRFTAELIGRDSINSGFLLVHDSGEVDSKMLLYAVLLATISLAAAINTEVVYDDLVIAKVKRDSAQPVEHVVAYAHESVASEPSEYPAVVADSQ